MSNGSIHGLLASSRTMDPYGYDSEEEASDDEDISTLKNESDNSPEASKGTSQLNRKYGIGAKLLSKMGYVEGQGLGKNGSGIANPIQVKPRSNASVGLGMLSDKRARNYETMDSSDEEQALRSQNIVAFKKTATETLSESRESAEYELRKQLKQRISGIQCDLHLEIPSGLLNKIDRGSSMELKELESIIDDLIKSRSGSTGLDHRIGVLERELRVLTDEERQLQEIGKDLADETSLTLVNRASKILSLSEPELVDKLVALLLRQCFPGCKPLEPSAHGDEQLVELVEMLQYQMDAATSQLNRTQSELHRIMFDWFLEQWQQFAVEKNQTSRIIFMLLDFEPVMRFINCFDYVKDKFILPKLFEALESWDLFKSSEFPPRLWAFDFFAIVDQSTRAKFEDIVAGKVTKYFDTWYHRDSPLISRPDLIFIQELLGLRYHEITRERFLPHFIEQLWDKHFDPLMELEDWKTVLVDEGSIYYARTLLKYRYYFDRNVFDTLLKAVFNEYNKILYQWLLYSEEEDAPKAKWWFCSIVNEIFQNAVPLDPELTQIRTTLSLLDHSTLKPVHDETFDLVKQLNFVQEPEVASNEDAPYTIQNIPLRKVTATFKSVVEDFCIENGYLMEKLQGQFAQLPYGLQGDTLVPLFRLSRGDATHNVALSNDILWLEKGKKEFVPTYLYELK